MDFGQALWCVKDGKKVAREAWDQEVQDGDSVEEIIEPKKWITLHGDLMLVTSDVEKSLGVSSETWVPTHADLLAEDWQVEA